MSNFKAFWQQNETIPAKSDTILNIPFKCNYFRITNLSTGTIYMSSRGSASPDDFDLKVTGGGIKLHVDNFSRDTIYFYNENSTAVDILILAYESEFSPVVQALSGDSNLAEMLASAMKYDGVIKGFTVPLPSGTTQSSSSTPSSIISTISIFTPPF